MKDFNDTRKVEDLDPKTLSQAIAIAKKLQAKLEGGKGGESGLEQDDLIKNKQLLQKLLEYLILNMDNPNMDMTLVIFLEKVLGVKKGKDKNKEEEEEKEEELTEEQKRIKYQQVMYEAYKILNPERLAGETSLENFISNVITRGIEVAREYDGAQYEKDFTNKEIEDLESHKEGFVSKLRSSGQKGGGRGL
ncbi:MAG: hypothetical protein ACI8ZF_000386 [Candidatus Midichloriaceae bacterium]|jgi:hypothetical protein